MAGGEVIPNGSVHWSIDVEELDTNKRPQGKDSAWTGNARTGSGASATPRAAAGRAFLHGVDPVAKDYHPTLRVILRAGSESALRAALEAALKTIVSQPGTSLVRTVVEIPSVDAGAAANDAPPNPHAQVRVEWGPTASATV